MRVYTGDHHNDESGKYYDIGDHSVYHGHVDGVTYVGDTDDGQQWTLHYAVHTH